MIPTRALAKVVGALGARSAQILLHCTPIPSILAALIRGISEDPNDRIKVGRGSWLQVARGIVALKCTEMREGDGAAIEQEAHLVIEADTDAEILLFDL